MRRPTGACLIGSDWSYNSYWCVLSTAEREGRRYLRDYGEKVAQVIPLPDDVRRFVEGLSMVNISSDRRPRIFNDLEWLLFEIWQRARSRKRRYSSRARAIDLAKGKLPIQLGDFPPKTRWALNTLLALGKPDDDIAESVFGDILRQLQISVWNAGLSFRDSRR